MAGNTEISRRGDEQGMFIGLMAVVATGAILGCGMGKSAGQCRAHLVMATGTECQGGSHKQRLMITHMGHMTRQAVGVCCRWMHTAGCPGSRCLVAVQAQCCSILGGGCLAVMTSAALQHGMNRCPQQSLAGG